MNIRRATLKDAATLSKLACTTFYDTFTGTCTEQDMEAFLDEYYSLNQTLIELNNPDDFFYLYEIDNRAVGYIKFAEDNSGFEELKNFKSLELKRLYVLKEYHGKGIAQNLMKLLFDFAIENNYNVVWLGVWEHNYKAQTFYKKYGFSDTGYAHPFPIGNTPQTDLWYWKQL